MLDKTNQNVANGIKLSVVDLPDDLISKKDVIKNGKKKKSLEEKAKSQQNSYVIMFAAEFIGTALLMFLGCMGCIKGVDDPVAPHHFGGLSFGLTVMLIIQVFGHISGAHLNPAVTIATVLLKTLNPVMGVVYVVAQFIGATVGMALLKVLLPIDFVSNDFCVTAPHKDMTAWQALGVEVIITSVLIIVCCAVWDKRTAANSDSTPLRFGFIIVAISMVAGPFTGASMNTARSFAPVLFYGDWTNQWVYLVGPTLAPFLGVGIYKYLFGIEDQPIEPISTEEQYHLESIQQNKNEF